MPVSYLSYELQDGYIHHWLVVDPQTIAIDTIDTRLNTDAKLHITQQHYAEASGATRQPVEPGPLAEAEFTLDDYKGRWTYTVCADDHFVDYTAFYSSPHYARAWAYTQIVTSQAGPVTLILTTHGPADVWLNDTHCCRHVAFGLQHVTFMVNLVEGANAILVRFEQVGAGACPHAVALRIADAPADMRVQLPTLIEDVDYRNKLEHLFASATLDRDVFVWDEFVTVHWPEREGGPEDVMIRLQTPAGRIYAESMAVAASGDKSSLVSAHQAPQGPLQIILMPRIEPYYDKNIRVRRILSVWGMGLARYAETPEGDYTKRRLAALQHAALTEGNLFGELAKMALGVWKDLELPTLLRHIERVNRREAGSTLVLLGLLGMRYRWGDAPTFPAALQAPLEACILAFAYDSPDDAPFDSAHGKPESEQILFHTCELLAGRLHPERQFTQSGQTGQWHADRGEQRVLDWLHARAMGGFAEWDSGPAVEAELTALAHLMDLVESEAVWEMATVVMDKLLFTLALNSHRGVLGGTQGRADAASLLGGWLSPMAGVTRLLWGVGILNQHIAAATSLACMEDYELPPLMEEIATTPPDELWDCEQHKLPALSGVEGPTGEHVNKVTYRTPDYLLGSAQDYRPGALGTREHIWQATLGPGAVVFTNHPACSGTTDAHVPGFWRGNGVLPRVAQWKDVLIAVYRLPDDDWMGYTHAYFPTYAFDAYTVREDARGHPWAFARKGGGYLAITAAQGFTLVTQEPGAYRELRSPGLRNVWLCAMGRAVLDGTFEAFQEKILALPVTFDDLSVGCTTLRNETLTFGWEGPFLRNGQEQPLAGFKHYENPYCSAELGAAQMEIKSDRYLMRLKFDL